jgi:hypothetical protein
MWAKWFTALALFGGLTVSAPAAPPQEQPTAAVPVEIRGRLQARVINGLPDGIHGGCLPPLWEYTIEADGQQFELQVSGLENEVEARRLNGQVVLVRGLLLDTYTVHVTELHRADGAPVPEYVEVTTTGILRLERPQWGCIRGGPEPMLWRLDGDGRFAMVDFEHPLVEARARMLLGQLVIVKARLKSYRDLVIRSVEPVIIALAEPAAK